MAISNTFAQHSRGVLDYQAHSCWYGAGDSLGCLQVNLVVTEWKGCTHVCPFVSADYSQVKVRWFLSERYRLRAAQSQTRIRLKLLTEWLFTSSWSAAPHHFNISRHTKSRKSTEFKLRLCHYKYHLYRIWWTNERNIWTHAAALQPCKQTYIQVLQVVFLR